MNLVKILLGSLVLAGTLTAPLQAAATDTTSVNETATIDTETTGINEETTVSIEETRAAEETNEEILEVREMSGAQPGYIEDPTPDITPTKIETLFPDAVIANAVASQLSVDKTAVVTQDDLNEIRSISSYTYQSEKPNLNLSGIEHLKNLSTLSFTGYSLESLAPATIVTSLTALYIYNSIIPDLDVVDEIVNLYVLVLNDVAVTNPTSIFNASKLTGLTLQRTGITDISGIEKLTELSSLSIDVKDMKNVEKIAELANLSSLDVTGIVQSDFDSLSKLTNLRRLSVYNGTLENLNALKDMKQLTELDFWSTTIATITAISALSDLRSLSIGWSDLADITALAELTKLEDLSLYANRISNISALSNLTKLTSLDLSSNEISTISSLANLTELTSLDIANNKISDISSLANLVKITRLSLADNMIVDITPLSNLIALENLQIENNKIEVFSALTSLEVIERLNVSGNNLNSIEKLAGITGLNDLVAREAGLTNLKGIEQHSSLYDLDVSDNQIDNIDDFANVYNLFRLDLANNKISDISSLSRKQSIFTLDISNNNISDISVVKDLSSLEEFRAEGNRISDFSALKNLPLYSYGESELNYFSNQTITLPLLSDNKNQTIENIIADVSGNTVEILDTDISNNGKYDSTTNSVSWENVSGVRRLRYDFSYKSTLANGIVVEIGGRVIQPTGDTIVENTAPVILMGTQEVTEPIDHTVERTAWAIDREDGDLVAITRAGANYPNGDILEIYRADDSEGLVTRKDIRIVTIVEGAPRHAEPTLNAPNKKVLQNTAFDPMEGVTATDKDGNTLEVKEHYNNVDTSKLGVYRVVYSTEDAGGFLTAVSREIEVTDVAPVPDVELTVSYNAVVYDVDAVVTEAEFLEHIGFTTSIEAIITTNFTEVVNFSKAGAYKVTINAQGVATNQANSFATTAATNAINSIDIMVYIGADSVPPGTEGVTTPTITNKTPALPKTGETTNEVLALGSAAILLGAIILVLRKKI